MFCTLGITGLDTSLLLPTLTFPASPLYCVSISLKFLISSDFVINNIPVTRIVRHLGMNVRQYVGGNKHNGSKDMGISLHDFIMLCLKVVQMHLFTTQLERSLVTDVQISNMHTEWSMVGVRVMLQAVGASKYTCSRAKSVSKSMSFDVELHLSVRWTGGL